MTNTVRTTEPNLNIRGTLIRDLVAEYPETMPVLAGYGIDLCCGGGHTVGEAASLHGEDIAQMESEVSSAIERARA